MRNASQLLAASVLCITVGMLAACGGGGDSAPAAPSPSPSPAPTSGPSPAPAPTGTPAPAPPAGPPVVVTGVATFASVPNNTATGALNYNAVTNKPARGVTVQAISGTTVLATASSSDQGTYSFTLPASTPYFVRMRAELIRTAGPANWNVAVKDNTNSDALWAVDSAIASSGTVDSVRSINAGSGWTGSSYGTGRAAGPFAILDTVYSGMKLVSSAQPSAQFPVLNVYWSPNNTTAGGNTPAIGEIGTSYFRTAIVSGNLTRAIYILGKQDNDTDEYDSAVVAHEYGHYLQSAFSTNHSLGGAHSDANKLDMTLAFSEGWGNAWSSMARNNSFYTDSRGLQQRDGFYLDLANPLADLTVGWYREDSVGTTLYGLFARQGFAPIWTALTGPMKTSQDAVATIFSFADAVRSAGNSAVTAALNSLLNAQSIFTGSGANQWGFGETNNGGSANNLPIYNSLALTVPTQVCFSNANVTPEGDANKLGSVRYFRINLSTAGARSVVANFPLGRDIDFDVFQNRQLIARGAADNVASGTTTESANVIFSAGDAVIRVKDYVTTTPSNTCATITVR
jgi:hypothetical protein